MESAVVARSAVIEACAATRARLAAIEAGGVPATVVAATALAALLHRYHGKPDVRVGHAGSTLSLRVRRDQPVGELLLAVATAVRRHDEAPPPALERPDRPAVLAVGGDLVLSVPGELPAEQTVESVARHFTTMLRAVVAGLTDGELTVGRLPLLDEAERRGVLVEWNDTADPVPPGHFHELVELVARRAPDALAVAGGGTRLTYRELDESANRLANHLAGLGVGHGDRVGIGLDRSPESLVAQLATFKLGAAAVLLDSSYPAQRLEFMLADSAAAALVTSTALADRFAASCPVVRYDADAARWQARPAIRPDGRVTDDTVCHVAYTSGSTGVPKAVLLRHGPLRNTVHVLRRQCGIAPGDRGSWLCSPGFGLVEVDCFPLLAAGASVHIPEPDVLASPERLRDWLVAERLTQSLVLTAMAERLWGLPWPAGTALKVMRIAGERARSWPAAELPFGVLNVYGSAEATVVATCDLKATAAAAGDGRLPPIGRPVANVRTYVLDEDLQPVPPGVVGELFVSGASLSAGYLNRPDVASAKFLPNPLSEVDPYPVLYRTGDLARQWPDGTLEVVGRLDHEVKIRGYRVHLGEVESVLAVQPGVRQCAVLAREDGHGELRLVGYVEPDPAAPPRVAELRRALEHMLPAYAVPGAYVVGDLPTTPNGKIDRAALPEPPCTRPDLDVPYLAPRGEWERLLAALFEQTLDIDGAGVLDSFFELGGDSLRAMRLLDRLRADHGVELSMTQLYAAPTVAELAELVEPAAATEPFPLTAAQRTLAGAADYFEWERAWLDVDRFRLAWRRMLDRHDALRVVLTDDGRQAVLPRVPHDGVTVTDLSGLPAAEATARLEAIRKEMLGAAAGPGRWPLHDLRLTLLPEGPVRIHLSLPALTIDAASAHQVLFTELADSYEDLSLPLPALPHTFAGYARTAAEPAPGERAPGEPVPAPAPPGEHRSRTIDPDVWPALASRAAAVGASPVAVLVAALGEVLGAAAGLDCFTIGARSFDRPPGYERAVGPFTRVRRLVVRTGNLTESARRLQAQLAGVGPEEHPEPPALPVLVTNLDELAARPPECPLGERIMCASRAPATSAELRIGTADGGLCLDWYALQQSEPGQFDDPLRDHLALIDWFVRNDVP